MTQTLQEKISDALAKGSNARAARADATRVADEALAAIERQAAASVAGFLALARRELLPYLQDFAHKLEGSTVTGRVDSALHEGAAVVRLSLTLSDDKGKWLGAFSIVRWGSDDAEVVTGPATSLGPARNVPIEDITVEYVESRLLELLVRVSS